MCSSSTSGGGPREATGARVACCSTTTGIPVMIFMVGPSVGRGLGMGRRPAGARVAIFSVTGMAVTMFMVGPSVGSLLLEIGLRECGARVATGADVGRGSGMLVIMLVVGEMVGVAVTGLSEGLAD
jgi:hypothetical protein